METPVKKRRWRRAIWLTLLAVAALAAVYVVGSRYINSLPKLRFQNYHGGVAAAAYPDARFAVISDTHQYDLALGTEGAAFEEAMDSDRKLLLESEELLDLAIGEIMRDNPQFVLVSGDLTKDGERANHERVAAKLRQIVDQGVPVYVVPGNHDINNPGAVRYVGEATEPVETVSADEFAEIYGAMGYGGALLRDDDSLSYVAEAVPGLWILGIDASRYRENQLGGKEIVSGKISQRTETWIEEVLQKAIDQQKAVIVLTHHGIVEHWEGQAKLHPDYLVQDYPYIGRMLASYHVRLAFSGHYHAQDIARADFAEGTLYDVETGSLITPPCPLRFCEISGGELTVQSETLVEKLRPGTDFTENAEDFTRRTVILEAYRTLRNYKVSETDSQYIAEAVGDAFLSHYRGDEDPARQVPVDSGKLGLWGKVVYWMQKYVVEGLWEDLPPGDNQVTIPLS